MVSVDRRRSVGGLSAAWVYDAQRDLNYRITHDIPEDNYDVPTQVIYRIDDHRFISLENYDLCYGDNYYNDTQKKIHTKVTNGTDFEAFRGRYIVDDPPEMNVVMTRGGSIVLLSSIMGTKGFPGIGAYSATKAAMRSFARTWANELKDRGIRVNSLSPGATQTPALDSQADTAEGADEIKAMFSQMTPLGRVGRADEIAAAALFLASDESSFSTGIDLVSDAGLVAV